MKKKELRELVVHEIEVSTVLSVTLECPFCGDSLTYETGAPLAPVLDLVAATAQLTEDALQDGWGYKKSRKYQMEGLACENCCGKGKKKKS
jgi:hypothetical protein